LEYAETALGCQGQSLQKGLYGATFPLPVGEGMKGRGDVLERGRPCKRAFTVRRDCALMQSLRSYKQDL
jgi:hypothetical protein